MTDPQEQLQFLPFHAINEFMRPDYRMEVVRSALQVAGQMPAEEHNRLEQLTRKFVKVAGFRNSAKAPIGLRIKATAEAFEKQPELVALLLNAWVTAHARLAQNVFQLLGERGWDILPLQAERIKLPGFLIYWPEAEDFEQLVQAYQAAFPDAGDVSDDISLMVVWISNRLPYDRAADDTP